jgi:hypothetical protein
MLEKSSPYNSANSSSIVLTFSYLDYLAVRAQHVMCNARRRSVIPSRYPGT